MGMFSSQQDLDPDNSFNRTNNGLFSSWFPFKLNIHANEHSNEELDRTKTGW